MENTMDFGAISELLVSNVMINRTRVFSQIIDAQR